MRGTTVCHLNHAARARKGVGMVVAAVLAACTVMACGESAQDKAQKQVCDARADIKAQIDTIRALPLTSASIDEATESLRAIETDIQEIVDAQDDLDPDRKQEVEAATKRFADQARAIAGDALAAGTTGNVEAALRSAIDQLAASYKTALEPIDCS